MEINFEYLVGDEVIVKTNKEKAKIQQRKFEVVDTGNNMKHIEQYYIKYTNKPASYQGSWIKPESLELDRVTDELKYPYEVHSVIIDANLLPGYRNDDMVRRTDEERSKYEKL